MAPNERNPAVHAERICIQALGVLTRSAFRSDDINPQRAGIDIAELRLCFVQLALRGDGEMEFPRMESRHEIPTLRGKSSPETNSARDISNFFASSSKESARG